MSKAGAPTLSPELPLWSIGTSLLALGLSWSLVICVPVSSPCSFSSQILCTDVSFALNAPGLQKTGFQSRVEHYRLNVCVRPRLAPICMLKPNPQCDDIWRWDLGVAGLVYLSKRLPCSFYQVRTQREGNSLWTRKKVFTRDQNYQHLDLGLVSLQNYEK